uniref:TnpV n=1 Tax=Heyndrickxia coagulans TaxID=1398 RepID=A0FJX6_HEYCO|nr:TnpV protein [Heyndrickxia coagulans]ABJ99981.1 TnpV [Heyndrickxia coagulans]
MKNTLTYFKNKKGQLIPEIQTSNDPKYARPLGKWGKMALKYLQETNPIRFMELQMNGTLQEKMHKINDQAADKFLLIFDQLVEKDPAPITEDVLVKTRHLNHLKLQAEEFVRNEIYESLASQIPNDPY